MMTLMMTNIFLSNINNSYFFLYYYNKYCKSYLSIIVDYSDIIEKE